MSIKLERRSAATNIQLPDNLHPLLRRIYQQRAIESVSELELSLGRLIKPDGLLGIESAVALLHRHLEAGSKILIVADFDADGATSCALAMLALSSCGAAEVDYLVPNRFEYGYGLTPEIVELAIQRQPQLLVTVDNGISSLDGVNAARAAGIEVLITDHHLAASKLPAAEAIVNPNQPGCGFPSKCIAGVGVIFYVMLALRGKLRECGWFSEREMLEPRMAELLDLVALGTVADVVALDHNNRILVSEGLRRIRAGRTRPGILALLEVAGRRAERISAADLGFSLGPRLNAAGRLDDMSTGIECLLAPDAATARRLAVQLDSMNQDRKQIEAGMKERALAIVDQLSPAQEVTPAALCLHDANWHEGVVGLVASRVKDRVHRPVIAFAVAGAGNAAGELKGSARSIHGFHIRDALDAIATRNPGLIRKFGGHAMAAGLSLEKHRLGEFTAAFIAEAERSLSEDQLRARVLSDGEVTVEDLRLEVAELLQQAGPWGQAFPEPLFDGRFNIVSQRKLAERHLKLTLSHPDAPQQIIDAIAFNVEAEAWPAAEASEIAIAYRLDGNEFRGRVSLQLRIEHILDSR